MSKHLVYVFVSVTGPEGMAEDDLVNNAREAIARAGYEVGNLSIDQAVPGGFVGLVEVEDALGELVEAGREGFSFDWHGVTVEAEAAPTLEDHAMTLTPEQQAELTRRTELACRLNRQILDKLDGIERIIKSIRGDAAAGCRPRYHGHLLSEVLQLNELGIRLEHAGD